MGNIAIRDSYVQSNSIAGRSDRCFPDDIPFMQFSEDQDFCVSNSPKLVTVAFRTPYNFYKSDFPKDTLFDIFKRGYQNYTLANQLIFYSHSAVNWKTVPVQISEFKNIRTQCLQISDL